ncbi:hypothetical protein Dcar01_02677 [Deinococcus carri]|uniref:RES domain-containing protein n=1 Tax=Deinococcus carri TaxID=1211323 RepID=A0ABP9W9A8_9DEIO
MNAYRIVHERALHQSGGRPLITQGATGRWNSQGVRITYLAEHPALAGLEMLNYVGPFRSVRGYQLYAVAIPETAIERAPETLDVHDHAQTRPFGDAWVQSGRSLALLVPSAAAPHSFNVLLNQQHPDFLALQPLPLGPYTYDERIAALVER